MSVTKIADADVAVAPTTSQATSPFFTMHQLIAQILTLDLTAPEKLTLIVAVHHAGNGGRGDIWLAQPRWAGEASLAPRTLRKALVGLLAAGWLVSTEAFPRRKTVTYRIGSRLHNKRHGVRHIVPHAVPDAARGAKDPAYGAKDAAPDADKQTSLTDFSNREEDVTPRVRWGRFQGLLLTEVPQWWLTWTLGREDLAAEDRGPLDAEDVRRNGSGRRRARGHVPDVEETQAYLQSLKIDDPAAKVH